jgi:hypothetical protein
VLTTPRADELQFVFGWQNLVRLKMLPNSASSRILALPGSANDVFKMVGSLLYVAKPPAVPARPGSSP